MKTGPGYLHRITAAFFLFVVLHAGNSYALSLWEPSFVSTPGKPYSAARGDFNKDGKTDLAVANYTLNTVSIHLGNGDGTFAAAVTYSVGTQPELVITDDFNGDGKLDLAVTNLNSCNISVLKGNGDGTFQAATNFAAGACPRSIAVADFDQDGKKDLVVANDIDSTVSILIGDGNGNFVSAGSPASGGSPFSVMTGDFNGDGKPDIATANYGTNNISVFINIGGGSFSAAVNYAAGLNPRSIVTGDFDGDGNLDLAAANYNGNTVSVLLGNGNGTFNAAVNYNTSLNPTALTMIDFNGDGHLDLAVANKGGNNVSVFLGVGDGTFGPALNFGAGIRPQGIISGNFDSDGHPDIVVADYDGLNLSILHGKGDGTFKAVPNFAVGTTPVAAVAADFNGDGKQDIAVTNYDSDNISILIGQGTGTFSAAVTYAAGNGPYAITAADFNGDGKVDLAVVNSWDNNVSIFTGDGNGAFGGPVNSAAGSGPWAVAAADFNGDGKMDLAVADNGANQMAVLIGNGDGTFAAPSFYASGGGILSVFIGDFNADGKLDVATGNSGGTVSVFLGNGNGTFGGAVNYVVGGSNVRGLTGGDFNGDGNIDLATVNYGSNNISVLLGNGAGAFGSSTEYAAGTSPIAIKAADFDGDGHLDIIAANTSSSSTSFFRGLGDGTFSAAENHVSGLLSRALTVADFNGDGKEDFLTADANAKNVWIFLNYVPDSTPDAYSFTDKVNVSLSTELMSNTITVSGINQGAPISISGCTSSLCEYRIGAGAWTSAGGTVYDGESVTVRQVSSASYSTGTSLSLDIGGVPESFIVTTIGSPALKADYRFQNNLTSDVASAPALNDISVGGNSNTFVSDVVRGATTTVLSFPQKNGLLLYPASSIIPDNVYTIAVLFSFADVSGYRRIVDFKDSGSDNGLYNYYGKLVYYTSALSVASATISPNTYVQVVLTRDNGKNVVGYVNGVQQFSFVDSGDDAAVSANDKLKFFRDNTSGSGLNEESAGKVSRIRIYDYALSTAEVAALEPAVTYTIDISRAGLGGGSMMGAGTYNAGTTVSLQASADPGSVFAGWGGDCLGFGNPASIIVDKNMACIALFDKKPVSGVCGSSNGQTLTSAPTTDFCSVGTASAVSSAGPWYWTCGGQYGGVDASCHADAQMTAYHALSVIKSGAGSGTVISGIPGIDCGTDCSEGYKTGTIVELFASPSIGSFFGGWTGDCSGKGQCIVELNSNMNVGALFDMNPSTLKYNLTVSKSGAGSGIVTSGITGIKCGDDCTGTYNLNQTVTLNAKAETGSVFKGWKGCNKASGAYCTVTMSEHKTVMPTFDKNVPKISVGAASLDFGSIKIGRVKNSTLKISNTGKGYLTISAQVSGDDAALFVSKLSGKRTIKSGAVYALRLLFKPGSEGPKTASLGIISSDPDTPELNIPLQGEGIITVMKKMKK